MAERVNTARVIRLPSASPSDEEIVEAGFDAVFKAYRVFVTRLGFRLLGRAEDVDDMVQEVFVDVHRDLHTLDDASKLKGWLATITRRKAWRILKKRRRRRWVELDSTGYDYEGEMPNASPEDRALLAQVFRALDGLKPDERIIWTLRRLERETMEVIATRCDCSLATAKRRFNRANRRLMEILDEL